MNLSTIMSGAAGGTGFYPTQTPVASTDPYAGLNPDQRREAQFYDTVKSRDASYYLNTPSTMTGMDRWVQQDPTYQRILQTIGSDPDPGIVKQAYNDTAAKYAGMDDNTAANALKNNWIDYGQKNLDFWKKNPSGTDDDWMDKIVETAMPMLVGGFMGAGALGALGVGGGGAGALGAGADAGLSSTAAQMGLGSLPINTAGLQSLGWMDSALGASGLGAAGASTAGVAGLGALGSGGGAAGAVGVQGGAPAVVSIGAPAGGSSLAPSAGGIGNFLGGSLPINTGLLQSIPSVLGGGSSSGSSGSSNLPSGLGNIFGDLGNILGANTDRIHNQQDQEYWQGLMDKATGMYMPGTPEANLMQSKMEAQDAAAGRNSQYGVRATNLAGMLADQRARIMTSPAFYQMGAASRGHYDNSLNSLFAAMGQNGGGSSGGGGSSIGSIFDLGKNLYNLFS